MRTTLHIDDDVYRAAKCIAEAERKTVGKVLSALARSALSPRNYNSDEDGIPVFVVSDNTVPLTPRMVKEAQEEE